VQATRIAEMVELLAAGHKHGYAAALDLGHVERAEALIDRWLAGVDLVSERWRRAFRIEPAFFVARFRHDPVLAAQLLESAGYVADGARTSGDLERARAAVHFAAGRAEAALAECEAATSVMKHHPPTGWSMLDRELLDSLRDDARHALQVVQ
jgi:hypothetical protein